jgi:hypothetical protein
MPTPGLMVVFPSHYAHRTRPTGVKALRISIAFDVLSANAADDAKQAIEQAPAAPARLT